MRCFYFFSVFILFSSCLPNSALAQSAEQSVETNSQIEGDFNNTIQIPNQNNLQNYNYNEIELSNIVPLVSPPNTENDFGFNFSVGVNQSETTAYIGVIFQPGRTKAHRARMQHLEKQIKLLETQAQVAEAKLKLLEGQINQDENDND